MPARSLMKRSGTEGRQRAGRGARAPWCPRWRQTAGPSARASGLARGVGVGRQRGGSTPPVHTPRAETRFTAVAQSPGTPRAPATGSRPRPSVQASAYQPPRGAPGGPAVQTTSSERPMATVQKRERPQHRDTQPVWAAAQPGPPESRPQSDTPTSPRGDDLGRKRPRSLCDRSPELCQPFRENIGTTCTDMSF